jgi:hypothetical protein
MKNQNDERERRKRFEAIFFIIAIVLMLSGFDGNLPLMMVGFGIFVLAFVGRYFRKKDENVTKAK